MPSKAKNNQTGGKRRSPRTCSVLWLSLPDPAEERDAPIVEALKKGDTWTTDMDQAARMAGRGYIVKRRDRRIDTGEIVETTLDANNLDFAIDRGFEMRGLRELNRPNS